MNILVIVSLGIAFIIPLGFLYGVRKLDLFNTGRYYLNFVTLLCGVAAYLIAARMNTAFIVNGWATREQVIRIIAPLLEETLKSLILIYIIQRADFNYIVDAVIYGFGAGIGFAIIENFEYVTGHAEIALAVAISRVFSTNLIHATGSGIIGTVLAYRRSNASWKSWLVIILGYLFSISFHMGFNTMVSSGALLIFAILVGAIGSGLIWYVIRMGLRVQKQWVAEKLGAQDRVTKEESRVISNIDSVRDEVLAPIKMRFGDEKLAIVKQIISKQAEIGIKRKLLETASGENKQREIRQIIDNLSADMNELRMKAGTYCMMFVRTVYLEQDIKVWNLLGSRIAESGTGQKGGGLWDRANARMKESAGQEEEEKS